MPKKKATWKKKHSSYTINDKFFGDLTIKATDKAWWSNREKVGKLILAFKMDCKPHECMLLAGITEDQLRYFREEHEEISRFFEVLRRVPNVKARQTIVAAIDKGDVATARWYAERKMSDEFKEKKDIEVSERPILIDDM